MTHSHSAAATVEMILEFNRDRIPELVNRKYRRMSEDAFAFLRGTDHIFAHHWSRLGPQDPGPSILICGDLHLENFGAYRTDDGAVLYDINDFDEALVAPCSLDLVRCTTSILLAAQLWKLSPVQAMRMVLTFLDRYRATVTKSVRTGHVGEMALGTSRGPIWNLLQRPTKQGSARFLDRFTELTTEGVRRIVLRPKRFLKVSSDTRNQITEALKAYSRSKPSPEAFEAIDVAFRVAGTGSLGLKRYAVLVQGVGSPDGNWLLDIKQAQKSALLGCSSTEIQLQDGGSGARRAVMAERLLQSRPTAKLDVIELAGELYRMRELIPEENRSGLDELREQPGKLRRAVAIAGRLVGWAHVRGSRVGEIDRSRDLSDWAKGPGLDAVIASAVRYAEVTRRERKAFVEAAPFKKKSGVEVKSASC
ncbi:DUF2252 family protein [Singulisphaera sp. PoT]|uniref:DUF2252 family protein n=1 Tax=Singulisphaera sp. PoT TaxID=3411797 RepID=UPI003BF4E6A7